MKKNMSETVTTKRTLFIDSDFVEPLKTGRFDSLVFGKRVHLQQILGNLPTNISWKFGKETNEPQDCELSGRVCPCTKAVLTTRTPRMND